ncbi:MAG TPA: hypothetical protein VIT88_01490 [Pyrinomonadaceae bacterium]
MGTSAMTTGLAALLLTMIVPISATAQTQTFSREGIEFTLELPSPAWRTVSRLDVHTHVEFINGDDPGDGYLRLRKRLVPAGPSADDLFRYDEKWELQRLPGYIVCRNGNGADLSGHLKGKAFSYEYVHEGKNMDGRIYYLQVDSRTFYILHFTIASDRFPGLREQIDAVARSFRLR